MIVSTKGRYALSVLIELAENDPEVFVPLKEISDKQNISLKYLENIMAVLSKAGLVEGVHGRGGGYRLTRRPEEYTLSEILLLTEGDLSPVACVSGGSVNCEKAGECKTFPVWDGLNNVIIKYLESVHLCDLLIQ